MSINDELEELKRSYRTSSPPAKVLMVLGFFMTLSSLTSLADTIFKWKGFIATFVDFYRSTLVSAGRELLSFVGLTISEPEFHAATLTSISVVVGMRVLSQGQEVAYYVINEQYGSDLRPSHTLNTTVAIVLPIAIWVGFGLFNPTVRLWVTLTFFLLYPFSLVLPKMWGSGDSYFERGRFSYFKSYYLYVGSILLIIGALAAVNEGLLKPMKEDSPEEAYVNKKI